VEAHRPSEPEKGRRLLLLGGVLAIVAGGIAIIVPAVASVGMDIFLGFLLVGASAVTAVEAFSADNFSRTAVRLLLALVTFAAGLYLLAAPLEGTYTLTVMLAIWFVAIGFTRIVVGIFEWGGPNAGLTLASGVVALVLGILIANRLPESADWAIGLLVGIDFVFYGVNLIAAWYAVGRLDAALRASPQTTR
jgi:uncharacterized membrane protein HdeD (DUF308 family)